MSLSEQAPMSRTTSPVASFLNGGIHLQEQQTHLHRRISDNATAGNVKTAAEISACQRSLGKHISDWLQMQEVVLGLNEGFLGSAPEDSVPPEDYPIRLPSSLLQLGTQDLAPHAVSHSISSALLALGSQEAVLREGQANDLLAEIRMAIKKRAAAYKSKRDHVTGQKANTRANASIELLTTRIARLQQDYNRIFSIICRLHPNPSGLGLQTLNNADLEASNALTGQLMLGEGKTRLSWIWLRHPGEVASEENDWSIERKCCALVPSRLRLNFHSVDRVLWFRKQAQMERWVEEVEILTKELEQMSRYFLYWEETWKKLLIENPLAPTERGQNAYIAKTSSMFKRFRLDS